MLILNNGDIRIKKARYGYCAYSIKDTYIGQSIDIYGEYSELEANLFRQILQPGMMAVEIGSNIGTLTVALAQAVGPNGAVVAIEPQRYCFKLLCTNAALNGFDKIIPFNIALAEPGSQKLKIPNINYSMLGNYGGVELDPNANGEDLNTTTLDNMGLNDCHFIKIDVEGYELNVLKGAINTIDKFKPIMYIENDRLDKSKELISFLLNLRYNLYWHLPPLWNPDNYFNNPKNIFGNIVSINMICIPPGSDRKADTEKIFSAEDRPHMRTNATRTNHTI